MFDLIKYFHKQLLMESRGNIQGASIYDVMQLRIQWMLNVLILIQNQ